jgi:hypothetical protein
MANFIADARRPGRVLATVENEVIYLVQDWLELEYHVILMRA